ncbi:MAG: 16S rRNA (adenine(1518)-N(6)/adenine(1519)-N(6))-dimethyltransferase RsmA [Actinomycetes bacterium]
MEPGSDGLLSPADLRRIAGRLDLRPTKRWGQNFVIDPNTVRRIVRLAQLRDDDVVLEVGPGLGSLTLGLLPRVAAVHAVEIDPVLAEALPATVLDRLPGHTDRLTVHASDATRLRGLPGRAPTVLVANLPYNVAVPVVLHLLGAFPGLRAGLVMVQAEVADRLAAAPGEPAYGVPSAKLAWYASAWRAGSVPARVFWPVPRVASGLVGFAARTPPACRAGRDEVFAAVDAAFAQRRKMLRGALAGWAGSSARAEELVRSVGIDPMSRGETLAIDQFARLADAGARGQGIDV